MQGQSRVLADLVRDVRMVSSWPQWGRHSPLLSWEGLNNHLKWGRHRKPKRLLKWAHACFFLVGWLICFQGNHDNYLCCPHTTRICSYNVPSPRRLYQSVSGLRFLHRMQERLFLIIIFYSSWFVRAKVISAYTILGPLHVSVPSPAGTPVTGCEVLLKFRMT